MGLLSSGPLALCVLSVCSLGLSRVSLGSSGVSLVALLGLSLGHLGIFWVSLGPLGLSSGCLEPLLALFDASMLSLLLQSCKIMKCKRNAFSNAFWYLFASQDTLGAFLGLLLAFFLLI